VLRIPLQLTVRSSIELAVVGILTLVGLVLILGTLDEYKSGRAFNRAMDNYAAGAFEDVYEGVEEATQAKPSYDAPRELHAKLVIDEGYRNPAKFAEARDTFEQLRQRQEAAGGRASAAVLIGLAVADLEAARAQATKPEAPAAAVAEARKRLEAALTLYPNSGDIHVNLATIALLENDVARCNKEIAKVEEAGDISIDALPVLYNLKGLVQLREKHFAAAGAEFEKVKEFAPEAEVPDLNLAAANAQVVLAADSDPRLADLAATSLRSLIGRLAKSKSPVLPRLCEAMASYLLKRGAPADALQRLAEAERAGKLTWQGRFNQALAQYLVVRAARNFRRDPLAGPVAELAQALTSAKTGRRERLIAAAVLGTIDAETGNIKRAIAHFESAAATPTHPPDPFIPRALARVHMSLGALHYSTGAPAKAIEHLDKALPNADDEQKRQISLFLKQVRATPVIRDFTVKRDKLLTDYDLQVSANLSLPGSPKPLAPEDATLTLTDTLGGTTRPLPFRLNGPLLYAVAVNLPQGRFRVELTLRDYLGNKDSVTSETLEVDREAPRAVELDPAPGTKVPKLTLVRCRLEDTLSGVDLEKVRVMLRYPLGSPIGSRQLVMAGRYQFPSADGAIPRNTPITSELRCPLPADKLPPGEYKVLVHAADTAGKAGDTEWSFTLAPQQQEAPAP